MTPTELESLLNQLLQADAFQDYCPNGLQVESSAPIKHIVTGVTACQQLIDEAAKQNADAVLVHHGYFWKSEPAPLTGMKGKRIRSLIQNNISLLAYHLPLDAHPTLGNNAVLAGELGLTELNNLFDSPKQGVGLTGLFSTPKPLGHIVNSLAKTLHLDPLLILGGAHTQDTLVSKVGLCTGAAQDFIEQAHAKHCDLYISGEASERTTHCARELGISYISAGHHATERGGIKALGEYLAQHCGFEVTFIDIDNPV